MYEHIPYIERIADHFYELPLKEQRAEFQDYIRHFRKTYIPPQFNQIRTLDYLTDDTIDYLMTVSNRKDGKSVNYKGFALAASYRFNLPFMLLSRHWSLRSTLIGELHDIIDTLHLFDPTLIKEESYGEYTKLYYNDCLLCTVAELDNSSDLRYSSYALKDCTWVIYDEFLTLTSDYVPNEALQFSLIYTSIDRKYKLGSVPLFKYLKVVCLGNPTNLNSPLLQMLHMTRHFQRQAINTIQIYDNVVFEKIRNDNQKDNSNSRAIPADIMEGFYSGDFEFNTHMVVSDEFYSRFLQKDIDRFTIKLKEGFLNIQYDIHSYQTVILEHTMTEKSYNFCTELYDIQEGVAYLDPERYTDTDFYRYYELGRFYFTDEIAREKILKDTRLTQLDLYRVIQLYNQRNLSLDPMEQMKRIEKQTSKYNEVKELARQYGEEWIKGVTCL